MTMNSASDQGTIILNVTNFLTALIQRIEDEQE